MDKLPPKLIKCTAFLPFVGNGLHKISTGIEAVTCRTELNLIKGTTAQFGNITRINFMRCYAPFLLKIWKRIGQEIETAHLKH
jgi:hypothetical protein